MKTDVAQEVLLIAKRVLENVDLGRIYPPGTVDWAQKIVAANAPPSAVESRARVLREQT